MKSIKEYPWAELTPGTGFFVPSLDLAGTREAGMKEAIKRRVLKIRAHYVIKDGKLGVIFYVPRLGQPSLRRS